MSAYSDLILAEPDLQSYWRLGESSGTTATAAFGAINGTYTGVGVTYGQPGLLAGDPAATSVLFDDGIPGSVSFGDVYGFENQAPFSNEIWVKVDTAETDSYIWSKGDQASGGWFITYGDPVTVIRRVDSGSVDDGAFTATTLGTTTHHIVSTYDGTTLSLYIDGALVDDIGSTRNLPDIAAVLRIAAQPDGGGSGFGGWCQDAAIYDAALSAAAVREHYVVGSSSGVAELGWLNASVFSSDTLISDFTGSDENPLSEGGNWAKLNSSGNALQRVSNAATGAVGVGGAYWTPANFGPDVEAYVTLAAAVGGVAPAAGIAVRVQGEGGAATWDGYYVTLNTGAANWHIRRVDNSVSTTLVTDIAASNWAAGDKIGVRCVGSTIQAWRLPSGGPAWVLLGSATDATYGSAGKIALQAHTSVSLDDFYARTL